MKTILKTLSFLIIPLLLTQCRETDKFYANNLRSDVFYQEYDENRYDFLWVFDNSGSMATRRAFVKDNLQTFINILNSRKAIDYQMALTSTDMFYHQGNLIKGTGNVEVVKSTEANPIGTFASIINNCIPNPDPLQDTSFWEQGLESSYQAMYKHGSKFSRPGVPLVLVYLTDEEDWSCKDDCWGVEPENNLNWKPWEMSRYINYFQNVKSAENTEVAVFPIVGLNTTDCTVASAGAKYMQLSDAVGNFGKSGSICNSSLKESYEAIARTIADRSAVFKLAVQASGDGISVYVDGVLIPFSPENYMFDQAQNAIIFTGFAPKKGAIIEVTYGQVTNE